MSEILVTFDALIEAAQDITRVQTKFNSDMETLEKTVEETTQHDWKGPDADLFVNNTKAKLAKIQSEYDEFMTKLIERINDNHDKFKDIQQKNISMQG